MKRDLYNSLEEWKLAPSRKPILLRGARQVGKSWLVREFGKTFGNYIELNFEENPELAEFFKGDLDPSNLLPPLATYFGKKIIPGDTLLFLDEIQACPRAVVSLRYFYEKMPQLHVVGAGSLIEFELRKISIPVGRIQSMYLYPMSFGEFLTAHGQDDLRGALKSDITSPLLPPIHEKLLRYIRDYVIVGGMPAAVGAFFRTKDIQECQKEQTDILETFRRDFNKYAKKIQVKYLRMIFDAAPRQLGNKFVYSYVSSEVKSRDLSEALELLEMAGIVYRVYHSSCSGIPLGASINPKRFKVLFFDVGLAQRLLGLDIGKLFPHPDITLINKGAIAELFVGLELIAYSNNRESPKLYYWHREKRGSQAEVDYVISRGEDIVPIEVKSAAGGRLYSLKRFIPEKKVKYGFTVTSSHYVRKKNIYTIPLYGIESVTANFGRESRDPSTSSLRSETPS